MARDKGKRPNSIRSNESPPSQRQKSKPKTPGTKSPNLNASKRSDYPHQTHAISKSVSNPDSKKNLSTDNEDDFNISTSPTKIQKPIKNPPFIFLGTAWRKVTRKLTIKAPEGAITAKVYNSD